MITATGLSMMFLSRCLIDTSARPSTGVKTKRCLKGKPPEYVLTRTWFCRHCQKKACQDYLLWNSAIPGVRRRFALPAESVAVRFMSIFFTAGGFCILDKVLPVPD